MGAPARALARPGLRRAALLALAAAALCLAFPPMAMAWSLDDALSNFFKGMVKNLMGWVNDSMAALTADNALGMAGGGQIDSPLESLFGPKVGAELINLCLAVAASFMRPMAATILTFCLMAQLVKAAQHTNAGATLPGVWEVGGIVVFYAIFSLLISKSDQVVNLFYMLSQAALGALRDAASSSPGDYAQIDPSGLDGITLGAADGLWLTLGFALIGVVLFVARVTCVFCVMGRAIQIYVMMMFSPVPMALLGADETRQMGIGFLRNVASLCFSVVIMVLVLYLFQLLVVNGMSGVYDASTGQVDGGSLVKVLVSGVLLVIGLGKSGAWAREVMGG